MAIVVSFDRNVNVVQLSLNAASQAASSPSRRMLILCFEKPNIESSEYREFIRVHNGSLFIRCLRTRRIDVVRNIELLSKVACHPMRRECSN